MLPGAAAGHAFFGEKGIDGQKTAWRLKKVRFLAEQGFELCDHTLWHANLAKYSDAVVQEQIARGVMAIDSAVPGYKVRTFALPLGVWPKNRALASERERGAIPRAGATCRTRSTRFSRCRARARRARTRRSSSRTACRAMQMVGSELEKELDRLDASGQRFVAGGSSRRKRGGGPSR